MTIQQLFRNRMTIAAVLGIAALAIAAAGVFSDRIFYLPAAMMGASALLTVHLAWTSYRFDQGKSGPPEWRRIVGEAKAWSENGEQPPKEAATGEPPAQQPDGPEVT
ncbi:MAG TPA: hypothetical protein VL500_04610 [Candidatus Eisenbacteria bacterium]|nr:hypothetical protein [Candidatus Eisenbacteria bacterium]